MKIVARDNLDRDIISDEVIAQDIKSDWMAKKIAKLLNEDQGPNGPKYYDAYEDDLEIHIFEP